MGLHLHRWHGIGQTYETVRKIDHWYEGPYGDGCVTREIVLTMEVASCRCGLDRHREIARESTAHRRARDPQWAHPESPAEGT